MKSDFQWLLFLGCLLPLCSLQWDLFQVEITSWLSIFRLGPYQWCRICLRSTSSHPDDFRGYIAKVPLSLSLSLSLSYLCNECTCQIAWNVGWFRTNDENYFLPIHQHISSKYANTSYDMYILMNWTSI